MKPAIHETQSSPYNMLKKHMTADLAAIVYGTPAQRLKISIVSATTSVSSSAVLTVSRQLAHHRVGVVGVDCDASMADSAETGSRAWLHWKKGERHDTCVGQDLLE
jgi:Mrp family chromosome partitioning ATPase